MLYFIIILFLTFDLTRDLFKETFEISFKKMIVESLQLPTRPSGYGRWFASQGEEPSPALPHRLEAPELRWLKHVSLYTYATFSFGDVI